MLHSGWPSGHLIVRNPCQPPLRRIWWHVMDLLNSYWAGHSDNFLSRRTRGQKFTRGSHISETYLYQKNVNSNSKLDQGCPTTGTLLLHWVKIGATHLKSLGIFFPLTILPPLRIMEDSSKSRYTSRHQIGRRGQKHKPHNTESEQKSLRQKEGEETFNFASICFWSETMLSKRPAFFPLALEIVSPLSIKHSFKTEIVLDASRHRSVFSKPGD